MNNSPLFITNEAQMALELKKLRQNKPKSYILSLTVAEEFDTLTAEFDLEFINNDDIAKNAVYDDNYPHIFNKKTATYLIGCVLDYRDDEFIFDHRDFQGYDPLVESDLMAN